MILKLLFMEWIFIIISITSTESYVFFAANLDDFRSMAKKIIPGQLADQLADMASKDPNSPQDLLKDNINVENKDIYEESDYSDHKIDINNDQSNKDDETDDHESDGSDLDTYKPLVIKSSIPRKRYVIKNQRIPDKQLGKINIDELVERVKEKLAKEFQVAKTAETKKSPAVTVDNNKKIDDYYYKDDKLNLDFTKNEDYNNADALATISQAFTTERQRNAVFPLHAVNNKYAQQYQDESEKADKIYEAEGDTKDIAYDDKTNVRDVTQYENVNQDYAGQNISDIPEYYDDNEKDVKENNKENVKEKYIKDVPEYYENHDKSVQKLNKNDNSKKVQYNIAKVKQVAAFNDKNLKKIQTYYEDNDKEVEEIKGGQGEAIDEDVVGNQENAKDDLYYEDDQKDIEPAGNPGEIFKEVDMLKKSNDSYEDYVTPKRDNIFESVEEQTQQPIKPKGIQKFASVNNFKYKLNKPKAIADPVIKKKLISYIPMMTPSVTPVANQKIKKTVTKKQEEIKGKTERMWYKDPNIENYDDSTKQTTEGIGNSTKKKRINTMFPTRAHYKMSSPNYLAKLPVVAEKYNFDEPLPEKDREPENLKHFGNPPAKINKKVRI